MNKVEFNLSISLAVDFQCKSDYDSTIMEELFADIPIRKLNDIWVLQKKYKKQTYGNLCVQDFFSQIPDYFQKINSLKEHGCYVCIQISIVSILGQVAFSLSPSDIALLDALQIPVEVSLFSYGCCIDDNDS